MEELGGISEEEFRAIFEKAWEESGLDEYYQRMDDLENMGFVFEDFGVGYMDYYQGEALDEWLLSLNDDSVTIVSIPLREIEEAFPAIIKRSEELKEKSKGEEL